MEKIQILYPAFASILLPILIAFKMRMKIGENVKNKNISFAYLRAYQGDSIPEEIRVIRDTYKNQFEIPILFYLLVAVIYANNALQQSDIILAWIFVVLRYMHAYIRLTSNNVQHRAMMFIVGLLVLLCEWVRFLFF